MNDKEKTVVSKMIRIYCRRQHSQQQNLCMECKNLESYAHLRLEQCTFGERKPVCKKCPIHCYKPDYRIKIKEIMRFSGPRIMFYHPIDTIKHLFRTFAAQK